LGMSGLELCGTGTCRTHAPARFAVAILLGVAGVTVAHAAQNDSGTRPSRDQRRPAPHVTRSVSVEPPLAAAARERGLPKVPEVVVDPWAPVEDAPLRLVEGLGDASGVGGASMALPAPPPEITIKVTYDGNELFENEQAPEQGPDGIYHYRGQLEVNETLVWWDWTPVVLSGPILTATGQAGVTNDEDDTHFFGVSVTFDTAAVHLPPHHSTDLQSLAVTTVMDTDDDGGQVATDTDFSWGTGLRFGGAIQWGNHYNPFYMYFSSSGHIVYTETWHDVNDQDRIQGGLTIEQNYSLTSGETIRFAVLYRIKLNS